VAAPAIAGVFDADFWLTHIPRTCHVDRAIWHAAVSIGAVYEDYVKSGGGRLQGSRTTFVAQQFNAAVKYLVHVPRLPSSEARWRALVASTLFTHLCSLQGLYSQSAIHLSAAKSLLLEFTDDEANSSRPSNPPRQRADKQVSPAWPAHSPVSHEAVLPLVANLETNSQAIQTGSADVAPALLDYANNAWWFYTSPTRPTSSTICLHGRCAPTRVTTDELSRAGRAFGSLLKALMTLSHDSAGNVARLVLEARHGLLETLIGSQEPHARAFWELDAAVEMFLADISDDCGCRLPENFKNHTPSSWQKRQQQKKAIDALLLYRVACYNLLFDRPSTGFSASRRPPASEHSDSSTRVALNERVSHALDAAESILQKEDSYEKIDVIGFVPSLPTTMPLFMMAHTYSVDEALRRRVVAILRKYPRRGHQWDSRLAAGILEASIEEEPGSPTLVTKDTGHQKGEQPAYGGNAYEQSRAERATKQRQLPLATLKVYQISDTFTRACSASAVVRACADLMAGKPER
jgi:hypothetical protein